MSQHGKLQEPPATIAKVLDDNVWMHPSLPWGRMTPEEWHSTDSSWLMLLYVTQRVAWDRWWRGLRPSQLLGQRKRRLLAIAGVRPHWGLLGDRERRWVELGEAYAEGRISWWDLPSVPYMMGWHAGLSEPENYARRAAYFAATSGLNFEDLTEALRHSIGAAACALPRAAPEWNQTRLATCRRHCAFVRDLAGDPFDPAPQGWATRFRGAPVASLAAAIHQDRAFDQMPKLAKLLKEEGCSVPQVLQHCREPAEHVRGCWVIDNLLGLPA